MDTAWLAIIIPIAIAFGTGISGYLNSKRSGSGRIRTSEADQLWEQTQALITSLQRDKERAEDQRDKLIDLQEHQMMPALEAITKGQQHLLGMFTELAGRIGKS
jgi:hypothetical protein